eukprot:TRINITY_DN1959_c4_g2_i2.p1 TRINITY_DN1959_c4_g2~~TRINITY_DN1959_c4_g2_i2.p1  ORF type:complete len:2433 (+),score=704.64 TRINITY_DN1959_c4_g2_i2:75-7301(+)
MREAAAGGCAAIDAAGDDFQWPAERTIDVTEEVVVKFLEGPGGDLTRPKAVKAAKLFLTALQSNGHRLSLSRLGFYFLKLCISEFLFRKFPSEDSGQLSFKSQSFVRDDAMAKFYLDWWKVPEHLFSNAKEGSGSLFDLQAQGLLEKHHKKLLKSYTCALIACIALEAGCEAAGQVILSHYIKPALEHNSLWMSDIVMIRVFCPSFKWDAVQVSEGRWQARPGGGGQLFIDGGEPVSLPVDCGHHPDSLTLYQDKNSARMGLFAAVARLIFRNSFPECRAEPGKQDDPENKRHCVIVTDGDSTPLADCFADTMEMAQDGAIYEFLKDRAARIKNKRQAAGGAARPGSSGNRRKSRNKKSKGDGASKVVLISDTRATSRADLTPEQVRKNRKVLWKEAKSIIRTPWLMVKHGVITDDSDFPRDGWVSMRMCIDTLRRMGVGNVDLMRWTPEDLAEIINKHDTLERFTIRGPSADGDYKARAGWWHDTAIKQGEQGSVEDKYRIRVLQDEKVYEVLGIRGAVLKEHCQRHDELAASWAVLKDQGLPDYMYLATRSADHSSAMGRGKYAVHQGLNGFEVSTAALQLLIDRGMVEKQISYSKCPPDGENIDTIYPVHHEIDMRQMLEAGWVLRRPLEHNSDVPVCLVLWEDNRHQVTEADRAHAKATALQSPDADAEEGASAEPECKKVRIPFRFVTRWCKNESGTVVWSKSESEWSERTLAEDKQAALEERAHEGHGLPVQGASGAEVIRRAEQEQKAAVLSLSAKKAGLLRWVRAATQADDAPRDAHCLEASSAAVEDPGDADTAAGDEGVLPEKVDGAAPDCASYRIHFPQVGFRKDEIIRARDELSAMGRELFCRVEEINVKLPNSDGEVPAALVFRKGLLEGFAARLFKGKTGLRHSRGFHNIDLLGSALRHRSLAPDPDAVDGDTLERQEFLGDSVIDFCVCFDIYMATRLHAAGQGGAPAAWDEAEPKYKMYLQQTTQNGRHAGREKGLRRVCLALIQRGYEDILRTAVPLDQMTRKAAADMLEAIFGAMYLDRALGLHMCHDRVRTWFLDYAQVPEEDDAEDPHFYSDRLEWVDSIRKEQRGGWVDSRNFPVLRVTDGRNWGDGDTVYTDRQLEVLGRQGGTYGAEYDNKEKNAEWILQPWPRMQVKGAKTEYSTHFKFTGLSSSYRRVYCAAQLHHRMLQAHEDGVTGFTNEAVSPYTRLAIDLDGIDANLVRFPLAQPGQSLARILQELVCELYPAKQPLCFVLDISRVDKSSQHLHWPHIIVDLPGAVQVLRYLKWRCAQLDVDNDALAVLQQPEAEREAWQLQRLRNRVAFVNGDPKGDMNVTGKPKRRKCYKCNDKPAEKYTPRDTKEFRFPIFMCSTCATTRAGEVSLSGRTMHALDDISKEDLQELVKVCLLQEWSDFIDEACFENVKLRMYLSDKFDEDTNTAKLVPVHQSRVLLPPPEGRRSPVLFDWNPGKCDNKAFPEIAEPVPHSVMQDIATLRHPCCVLDTYFCQKMPWKCAWRPSRLPSLVTKWMTQQQHSDKNGLDSKWAQLPNRIAAMAEARPVYGSERAERPFGLLQDNWAPGSAPEQVDLSPDEREACLLPKYRCSQLDFLTQLWHASLHCVPPHGGKRQHEAVEKSCRPDDLNIYEKRTWLYPFGHARDKVYIVNYAFYSADRKRVFRTELWLRGKLVSWAERYRRNVAELKAKIEWIKKTEPPSAKAFGALLRWRGARDSSSQMEQQLVEFDTPPGLEGDSAVCGAPRAKGFLATPVRQPFGYQGGVRSASSGGTAAVSNSSRPSACKEFGYRTMVRISQGQEEQLRRYLEQEELISEWQAALSAPGRMGLVIDTQPGKCLVSWYFRPDPSRELWLPALFLSEVKKQLDPAKVNPSGPPAPLPLQRPVEASPLQRFKVLTSAKLQDTPGHKDGERAGPKLHSGRVVEVLQSRAAPGKDGKPRPWRLVRTVDSGADTLEGWFRAERLDPVQSGSPAPASRESAVPQPVVPQPEQQRDTIKPQEAPPPAVPPPSVPQQPAATVDRGEAAETRPRPQPETPQQPPMPERPFSKHTDTASPAPDPSPGYSEQPTRSTAVPPAPLVDGHLSASPATTPPESTEASCAIRSTDRSTDRSMDRSTDLEAPRPPSTMSAASGDWVIEVEPAFLEQRGAPVYWWRAAPSMGILADAFEDAVTFAVGADKGPLQMFTDSCRQMEGEPHATWEHRVRFLWQTLRGMQCRFDSEDKAAAQPGYDDVAERQDFQLRILFWLPKLVEPLLLGRGPEAAVFAQSAAARWRLQHPGRPPQSALIVANGEDLTGSISRELQQALETAYGCEQRIAFAAAEPDRVQHSGGAELIAFYAASAEDTDVALRCHELLRADSGAGRNGTLFVSVPSPGTSDLLEWWDGWNRWHKLQLSCEHGEPLG